MAKQDEIKTRWTEPCIAAVNAGLTSGRVESPFGRLSVEGRQLLDLRGLPLAIQLCDVELEEIDMSGATLGPLASLIDVKISRGRFVGAKLGPNISGVFEECSFEAAKMVRMTIHGATFERCSFHAADLSHAHGRVVARQCSFESANMKGVHFLQGVFESCRWEGCRFAHASLARSRITRSGFPSEYRRENWEGILPPVILKDVQWM